METKETVRVTPRERYGKMARGNDCGGGCGLGSSPATGTGRERNTETKEAIRATVNDGDGKMSSESDCSCGCGLRDVAGERAA